MSLKIQSFTYSTNRIMHKGKLSMIPLIRPSTSCKAASMTSGSASKIPTARPEISVNATAINYGRLDEIKEISSCKMVITEFKIVGADCIIASPI